MKLLTTIIVCCLAATTYAKADVIIFNGMVTKASLTGNVGSPALQIGDSVEGFVEFTRTPHHIVISSLNIAFPHATFDGTGGKLTGNPSNGFSFFNDAAGSTFLGPDSTFGFNLLANGVFTSGGTFSATGTGADFKQSYRGTVTSWSAGFAPLPDTGSSLGLLGLGAAALYAVGTKRKEPTK